MALDIRETTGYEPIGSRLPGFMPPLYRDFFAAMIQGERFQPAPQQIDAAIEVHLAYEPLTPLTAEQEARLRADMRDKYEFCFSSPGWEYLTGDTFFVPGDGTPHPMKSWNFFGHAGLLIGEEAQERATRLGIEPIKPGEKEAFLTDPVFYNDARILHDGGSYPLLGNGTRHLCNEQGTGFEYRGQVAYDTYGYTIAEFKAMLSQVRVAQGKTEYDKLKGLDIGGSNGLGAHDAEDLDPNLDVTNIAIDPELGVWPLRGGHRLLQAERLPRDFSEQFDIIISNIAFRYMRYRDIALENAIRALRKGGILSIHFSSDRLMPGDTFEQIERDIKTQFQRMETLREQGIIRHIPMTSENFYDARENWHTHEDKGCMEEWICLQKTGAIE